ncbi:hypothetical protein [Shimia aestuarii]|uniref:hypothetical protein n=1 Tax=Shimia aestuarii TaxID=254406 RepID=UPI001FB5530F|nr:hypothetical protein [Shimia aestuarii]
MPDKPILFSGPMVRALLDGRKTQTRRVVKPQPKWTSDAWHWQSSRYDNGLGADYFHTPHVAGIMSAWVKAMPYAIGDRLWVREAHYLTDDGESEYAVFAEDEAGVAEHLQNMQTTMTSHPQIDWSKHIRLRPSIHMPRWASRLTLVVTDVRVQRVQEINRGDAMEEGCPFPNMADGQNPRDWFRALWDSLNACRNFGWDANPWVAAYTFAVQKCNIDQMEIAA